ncbi:ribosomal RNA small subunit methyltransferase A [bacterium]|nr:ribosomal RNA small subunit methyltransferase A [bacterium]
MKKDRALYLLEKHGLRPNKSLGQNFLLDENVLDKIVETTDIQPQDNIIEVGPGLGVLTRKLAELAAHVTAIELDRGLVCLLERENEQLENVDFVHMDALKYDPPKDIDYKLVANIPYYITSPLISHFLMAENRPKKIVVLIQKEVAEKICAGEGKLNVLALHVQIFGKPRIIAKVSPGSFYPEPKVDSAVLEIDVHDKPVVDDYMKLYKLVHRAFAQKRKKLTNSLPEMKDKLIELELGSLRPERLTIEDWERLV